MAFVARLPTWNQTVLVYRCADGDPVPVLRGSLDGQVYSAFKRAQTAVAFNMNLLYPWDAPLILYSSPQLPSVGAALYQHDIVVFDWPLSPFDDGAMYAEVSAVSPRYKNFPNQHNVAVLQAINLEGTDNGWLYWFGSGTPPDPPSGGGDVEVAGVGEDECADCSAYNGTFSCTNQVSPTRWDSDPFSVACTGLLGAWTFQLVGTLAYAGAIYEQAPGLWSTLKSYTADASGWNGTDPLTLDRQYAAEDHEGYCLWPSTVDFVP